MSKKAHFRSVRRSPGFIKMQFFEKVLHLSCRLQSERTDRERYPDHQQRSESSPSQTRIYCSAVCRALRPVDPTVAFCLIDNPLWSSVGDPLPALSNRVTFFLAVVAGETFLALRLRTFFLCCVLEQATWAHNLLW